MENIKEHNSLTDIELFKFLNEIENDNEDMQEAQSDANKKIALEEERFDISEEQENQEIEARYGYKRAWVKSGDSVKIYGPDERVDALANRIESRKQNAKTLREKKIQIQRKAFSQEDIQLSEEIGIENIKLLLSLLVKEHTRIINKYEIYINRLLTKILNALIPKRLKECKKAYPDSMRKCPGFLYKASEEYGASNIFWAEPDIPYYFKQNTEQNAIKEYKPELLIKVDQSVKFYHEHVKKRTDKEIKYASLIYRKGIKTYYDLLKLNPFWYEILYNYLQNKN